jgi:bifunctional DNase/RNase
MIEVKVDSIRVSLMSQHRVVVLRDIASPRYLPIWIGPSEAEAIASELQGMRAPRPMTHDLLKNALAHLGAQIMHVTVTSLRGDTFYARIFLDVGGKISDLDSRPSDAIALAVRAQAPIYVSDEVLRTAGMEPESGISIDEDDKLAPYRDFVDSLDVKLPGDEDTQTGRGAP